MINFFLKNNIQSPHDVTLSGMIWFAFLCSIFHLYIPSSIVHSVIGRTEISPNSANRDVTFKYTFVYLDLDWDTTALNISLSDDK